MGNEQYDDVHFENDDSSFIYTAIQILYKIKDFKNIIINDNPNNYSENQLWTSLKDIFQKDENNLDLENNSKRIYKIITEKYNLKIGDSPGKILIQIFEILNCEENGNNINEIWEKSIMKNNNLLMNALDKNKAYNDFYMNYEKNNKGKLAKLFHGFLLTKRAIMNSMLMHFFNYYCVYEINITSIAKEKNLAQNVNISLFDCINNLKTTKMDFFNNMNCFVEHHMYKLPKYLFFFINRDDNSIANDLNYGDDPDFSSLVYNNGNNNGKNCKYKLIFIIKQKRYIVKKREKEKENDWFEEGNFDNNMNKFITIQRELNGKYISLDKNNYPEKYKGNDEDYYINVLVYEKC